MAAVAAPSRVGSGVYTSLLRARLLLPTVFTRIGLTKPLTSQPGSLKVDKSLLSKLRNETGFGFSKCLESLQHCNNDYDAAVVWLEAEAGKQGWEKATKLRGRATSEGLIGISVEGNFAAMVEVNCETDFVARNELFVDLVSKVANAAMAKRKKIVEQNQQLNAFGRQLEHLREIIPEYKLRSEEVQHGNGETVADCLAKTVGKLGENIKVNKVVTMTTQANNVIGHYVHGPFVTSLGMCSLGRYGGIVALRSKTEGVSADSMLFLANRLARHVVGMNPCAITEGGSPPQPSSQDGASDVLLEQEYLLDDSLIVGDLLNREGVEVVDFVRYECSGSR